jgi:hypothetical protein
MLAALDRFYGRVSTDEILGIDKTTGSRWRRRITFPTIPSLKLVWIIWAQSFRQKQIQSMWDVKTWGRFHGEQIMEPEPDYEI